MLTQLDLWKPMFKILDLSGNLQMPLIETKRQNVHEYEEFTSPCSNYFVSFEGFKCEAITNPLDANI